MSLTESPKFGQPRIADGTFVIFSFDPAAYASAIDSDDKIVSAAAAQIQRKKYLGLVEGMGPLDLPQMRQNLEIRVIGLAPPQEGEDDLYPTNPSRCVPVSAGTTHSEGRAPLLPSVPLPWPECYVHTLQLVNAFVSRVHHANPTNATVTKGEMARLAKLVVHDQYAAAKERRAAEPVVHDDDESESDDGSQYSEDSGDEDVGSELSDFDEPAPQAPSKPYMEIWEDLTIATTLGEPKDVGADVDEIMAIGEEWEERKKQERRVSPKTLQWASQVANLEPHDFDPEGVAAVQVGDTCDDLRPEDAVDERREPKRDAEHSHAEARSDLDTAPPAQVNDSDTLDDLNVESPQRGASPHGEGSSLFLALRRWIQLVLRL